MLGGLSVIDVVLLIIFVLIAMVIHETAHAYAGLLLGDRTAAEAGRVSLNPLRHIDPVMTVALPIITILAFGMPIMAAKPVPFDPEQVRYGNFGAALIAFAGPFSNLLLAIVAAFGLRLAGVDSAAGNLLYLFIGLNVALFVFNLIPIPPLDGSRVLYAFAPEPLQDLMRQIEPVGLYIIFALVLLGGFGGFLVGLNQLVLKLLLP